MVATFNVRNIFILGSSGFAREIKTYLIESLHTPDTSIFFVDDSEEKAISVAKYHEMLNADGSAVTILGSGKPDIKKKMISQAKGNFLKFIHPASMVSSDAAVDIGSVVAPGAVVSAHAIVGEHVLINYNCTIGHDSIIGSMAVVSPGVSVGGWVTVGEGAYIGSGAQLKEKLTIGDDAIIGMGAVVLKDVPAEYVAVGSPAQAYSREEWEARIS